MKKSISFIVFLLCLNFNFAQSFRDSIDVLKYTIDLEININQENFFGNTTVKLKPVFNNTKSVKLDLLNLNIDKIYINNKKNKNWKYDNSIISIPFKKNLNKNDTLNIKIFYNGSPIKDKTWGGFYFLFNNAFNMGVGMTAVPHSFGRVWYPCNDIFTDKAIYKYIIKTPKNYIATCGGLNTQINKFENKTEFVWVQNKPIPTYLSSVSVAKYEIIEDRYITANNKTIPVKIFTFNGKKNKTKNSFKNLKNALKLFEKLFGPYPWDKIGYSEVNFSFGAMEHAENISITKYALNGNLQYEYLLYHELSHSWFGNYVTCKNAQDMWLNEGWASYCEALFFENIYGKDIFYSYNRSRHFNVLHKAHIQDNGYRALANMDLKYTYGKTVYDKGADVVHTLRFYLGDSLFFPAVKKYLKKHAFSNASSENLKNTLSYETGINLNDFFDFWVYSKGFPFFTITDILSNKKNNGKYNVTVKIDQRICGGNNLCNSNKIEIFFMDKKFNIVKRIFEFSGKKGKQNFILPFKPAVVMLDKDEHLADAAIDVNHFIEKNGNYNFKNTFCELDVQKITDKSFVRIICNVIDPDNTKKPGYYFQKNYYWTLKGIWNNDFNANIKFSLKDNFTDKIYKKLNKPADIVLMYRKNNKAKWEVVNSETDKNFIKTKIKQGDYALAVKTYE